jgi:predicted deacylase
VPLISLKSGSGPTILITGGTHGDEFEGPSAIMRLAQRLSTEEINGQLILIPGLNAPALAASSRVTPLDGANLNRAFPGEPDGGPTAMLAHYIESEIIPRCDAVIDLHSGGKASFFQPCALATRTVDNDLYAKNMVLASVFGLPMIWVLGANNDNRSLNSAAERAGIAMIATELGGGGGVDPTITAQTETGLMRVLHHLAIIDYPYKQIAEPRKIEIASAEHSLYAPAEGLFDRQFSAGQNVTAGEQAGWFHYYAEPERPSIKLTFPHNGYALAHTNRGVVRRGELLALVARDIDES